MILRTVSLLLALAIPSTLILSGIQASAAKPEAEGAGAEPEQTDPAVDQAMDDAEGVRSVGLKLPDAPKAAADDFAGAWDQF